MSTQNRRKAVKFNIIDMNTVAEIYEIHKKNQLTPKDAGHGAPKVRGGGGKRNILALIQKKSFKIC
jgi:hypothetical protein